MQTTWNIVQNNNGCGMHEMTRAPNGNSKIIPSSVMSLMFAFKTGLGI